MSCCGQKRAAQSRAFPSPRESAAPRATGNRFGMGSTFFVYTGKTPITALGGVTGRHYRFVSPGAPVLVDARDRASLAKVPFLREVG
jgi:hypothetical protein